MEFRQLTTFRELADNLSFTKTAQKLFMAQSSVSAQIKALEDELAIKLFDRIGRRVLLTDAGRKLYEYARRMEEMSVEIRSEISDSRYSQGSLTIRVPETLAAFYMPAVVDRFHKDNPKARLNFINCTDRQLQEELNSGRIDLAFLMTDAIHFKDVNVKMLKTEPLVLVAAPCHPLLKNKTAMLADLEGETVLMPKTDWSYRRAFERSLEKLNVSPLILEFSSMNSLKTCLKMGIGITLCPELSVRKELLAKKLEQLIWNTVDKETSVIMIWHAHKWCSPLLNQFLKLSEELISD